MHHTDYHFEQIEDNLLLHLCIANIMTYYQSLFETLLPQQLADVVRAGLVEVSGFNHSDLF